MPMSPKERLLTIAAKLEPDLTGDKLEYEIMSAGVVWDEDRELVQKVYEILEDYRKEQGEE